MIHDSVREDLTLKIIPLVKPIPKPANLDLRGNLQVKNTHSEKPTVIESKIQLMTTQQQKIELNPKPEIPADFQKVEVVRENPVTSELDSKHTNPTLVEFQNKNAKLPEWRLELKNLIRKRNNKIQGIEETEIAQSNIEIVDSPVIRSRNVLTSGANALKVEEVAEGSIQNVSNPKLAAALKRIEKSRKKYLEVENSTEQMLETPEKRNNTLLYFTAKPNDHLPKTSVSNNYESFEVKQKAAVSLRDGNRKLDTNKLPPLPKPAKISSSFNQRPVVSDIIETNFVQKQLEKQEIVGHKMVESPDTIGENEFIEEIVEIELQEIDDCAPFAMRFNAGLFDLIIGSFAGVILLTPFMAMGGEWFSLSGFFAFITTVSIVMFVYLTIAVGFYAKTLGMKLFSLEVVDIGGEEYPTIHQAAVSACVYLISLILGGIGFVTLLFNEEKRAAHDLASKTIVVKEF
jgi:uncharacterized RDD family membrane protein YckC